MKVNWSVLVGDAAGRAGNLAATHGYAGAVLRSVFRNRPTNTQLQLEMRAALGTLSSLWADPSMNAERAGWVSLGLAHGEPGMFTATIYKTGLQWFLRCNRNRQTIGEAIVTAAPAFAAVGDPGALTLIYGAGPPATLTVNATSPNAAGEAVIIFATRGLSPGILTLSHQQRKTYID